MENTVKRRIAIGASGLALFGGAGGAFALNKGSGGSSERAAFIDDAAKRLNVSPDQLRSALRGAFFDRLDAAVKNGRITQKQADEMKAHMRQNGAPGPLGPRRPHPRPPFMEGIRAAAKYLGLTPAQLRTQLDSGKSLAQVAKDRNKSVDGLKAAIKDALRGKLDTRVDKLVNRTGPPEGREGPGFRGGPPPGGPPPGAF